MRIATRTCLKKRASLLFEATMKDEKRFLRELKRSIKKAGNRKRRRYLKHVSAEADDFSFGRDRTDVMNEKPRQAKSPPPST
jgi:hypothetical protein